MFQTYDIGMGLTPFAGAPRVLAMRGMQPFELCIYDFWVAGVRDAPRDQRTIVWDDCVEGRLQDIRATPVDYVISQVRASGHQVQATAYLGNKTLVVKGE